MLNVFVHDLQAVVGQWSAGAEKTNEPTLLRRHLEELLDAYPMLRLFTGDAIFAQRPLAELVCSRGRDYLLQVKANQGNPLDALEHCFAQATERPPAAHSTNKRGLSKKSAGYGSTSRTPTTSAKRSTWSGCRIALRVDRQVRTADGELLSHDVRYFVSSLDPDRVTAADLLRYVRDHWRLENGLHFVKDRWWDEDRHHTRRPGLSACLAAINNAALLHPPPSAPTPNCLSEPPPTTSPGTQHSDSECSVRDFAVLL